MIEKAREFNQHPETVSFEVNRTADLALFPSNRFDFILTLIVLQHIPTEAALGYVKEFQRVLAPGGWLVFQIPAAEKVPPTGVVSQVKRGLKRLIPSSVQDLVRRVLRPGQPVIPMYPVARARVESLLAEWGLELRHVDWDTWAGTQWESYTYYARKPL